MKTSVIVPCYNRLQYTKQLLDTMAAVSPPDQLIVVDNGSTDGTWEYLLDAADKFAQANTIFGVYGFTENRGFGVAMNVGMERAVYDTLVFLSNDVKIITADWLDELKREAESNPTHLIGAEVVTNNLLAERNDGGSFPYLAGWVLCLKTELAKTLCENGKLFDERFFAYYEDVDLCVRAMKHGVSLHALWTLGLFHFGGKTAFSLPNQLDILKDSRRKFAEKHGITWRIIKELGE